MIRSILFLLIIDKCLCQKKPSDVLKDINHLQNELSRQEIQTYRKYYTDRKLYNGLLETRLSILIASNQLTKEQTTLIVTELVFGYVSPLHVLFFYDLPLKQITKMLKNQCRNSTLNNILKNFENNNSQSHQLLMNDYKHLAS